MFSKQRSNTYVGSKSFIGLELIMTITALVAFFYYNWNSKIQKSLICGELF